MWEALAGPGGALKPRNGVRDDWSRGRWLVTVSCARASVIDSGRTPWSCASGGQSDALLAWLVWRSFRMRAGLTVSRSVVELVAGPSLTTQCSCRADLVGAPAARFHWGARN